MIMHFTCKDQKAISNVLWCMGLLVLCFLWFFFIVESNILTHAVSTNDTKESTKILSRIQDIQVGQAVAVYICILY